VRAVRHERTRYVPGECGEKASKEVDYNRWAISPCERDLKSMRYRISVREIGRRRRRCKHQAIPGRSNGVLVVANGTTQR